MRSQLNQSASMEDQGPREQMGQAFSRPFLRPLRRFCTARDNLDLCLCDLATGDRRDPVLFAVLARNRRPPALRDLRTDFFTGCRLSALFEAAVARLTAFRTGRSSAAAFPTRAPITPPTTAPVGPAMLPIAAPVTAPAVCFGIGGTWISSDDDGLFFFSGFGRSGINGGLLYLRFATKMFRMTKPT